MSRSKIIWLVIICLLVVAGVADGIRYLKPSHENKIKIETQTAFPISSAKEIILCYNAYGGIYPGIKDFFHKIIAPASYPCNLCYLTFGTFSMKKQWKSCLDSLGYKIVQLHKDQFKRKYIPSDMKLPAILISNGTHTEVLATAEEINACKSLQELEELVRGKIRKF